MTKSSLVSTHKHYHEIALSETEKLNLAFKSVSLAKFLTMRSLASKLVDSFTDLFAKATEIPATETEVNKDPITDREVRRVTKTDGISQEVLISATDRRKKAMNTLLEIFMDQKHNDVVCDLIANSLRDEEYTKDEIAKTDIDVFAQLVVGFLQANMGVLAPLMGQLGSLTGAPSENEVPASAAQ